MESKCVCVMDEWLCCEGTLQTNLNMITRHWKKHKRNFPERQGKATGKRHALVEKSTQARRLMGDG